MHHATHPAAVSHPPLRVAIWIDSLQIPSWQALLLERIRQSACAQVELLVVSQTGLDEAAGVGAGSGAAGSLWCGPAHGARPFGSRCLESIHRHLIEGYSRLPDPLAVTELPQLPGVETIAVRPIPAESSADEAVEMIDPADLERLRSHPCDVVVRLGCRRPCREVLAWPRYGVWSIHHGGNGHHGGSSIGYWESMEDWPTTDATLRMASELFPQGIELSRASSSTNPWSIRDNRAAILWRSTALVPRQLARLHHEDASTYFARVQRENQSRSLSPPSSPGPLSTTYYARQLADKLQRKLRHKLTELTTFGQWILYYELSDKVSTSFGHFRPLVPPRDRIWADPHVIQRDGRYYVFIEEFFYRAGRGHISVLSIDEQGRTSAPMPVLKSEFHLSYPFVFEADGQVYMIPETASRRSIELYRCTRFPDQWELDMQLMRNVHAVDATLYYHADRWWMFANMVEPPGTSSWDELFLFSAEDFRTQDWQPHPLNPIVADVSRARPAGRLFTLDGQLYRPSQNCGGRYGRGFNLNLVKQLSTTDYQEQVAHRVLPDWRNGLLATHTFSRVGRLTIIDAQLRRWGRPG